MSFIEDNGFGETLAEKALAEQIAIAAVAKEARAKREAAAKEKAQADFKKLLIPILIVGTGVILLVLPKLKGR